MAATLTIIAEAIHTRTPIRFRYVRRGKTPGTRTGNPHVAFLPNVATTKDEHVSLLLWQTEGATDEGPPLPSWRTFIVDSIVDVTMVAHGRPFGIAQSYRPEMYDRVIAALGAPKADDTSAP